MQGLRTVSHRFNFDANGTEMEVLVDDRDGQIFVTDDCLQALRRFAGPRAARIIAFPVVIDGKDLNLLSGFTHERRGVLVSLAEARASLAVARQKASNVIAIGRAKGVL